MSGRVVLIVLLLLVQNSAAADKLDQIYSKLSWGEHAVGFRVVNARDYGRTYSRLRGEDGKRSAYQMARPIQIGIWYPADTRTQSGNMTFLDYVALDEIEGKNEAASDQDYLTATNRYLKNALWTGKPDTATLQRNLSLQFRAYRDAPPEPDSQFPVVVFAGHENFGLSSNALLHEFIASHGYVVVSFKNNTIYPGARNFKQHAIATAQDIRFVKRYAESLSTADATKMVIAGNSLGALAIFDVALDIWSPWKGYDHPFRGIVSINGEIGSRYHPDYIGKTFSRMKISTISDFEIPLLHFACKGNDWCNIQYKKVEKMFDSLRETDSTMVSPNDLTGKEELSGMAFTSYYLITDLSSYQRFRQNFTEDKRRFDNQIAGFSRMAEIYLSHLNLWLSDSIDEP